MPIPQSHKISKIQNLEDTKTQEPSKLHSKFPLLTMISVVSFLRFFFVLAAFAIGAGATNAQVGAGNQGGLRRALLRDGYAIAPTEGGGVLEHNCGAGGCNCWGSDDCKKLIASGDCNGNPLRCDKNNPDSCHCD